MFAIDVNALKNERFVVPPLRPLGRPGYLEAVSDVSLRSPAPVSEDTDSSESENGSANYDTPDIWTTKSNEGAAQNLTFSWDGIVQGAVNRGAFLSEQSARVFVASRYHVQPRLELESCSTSNRRFISPLDLLLSLQTTLLGATSLLFGWDETSATFFVRSEGNRCNSPKETILVLGELSEETTTSLVEPFLQIGAMLRRLDIVVATLQGPATIPTARALAYSLQSVTGVIQADLTSRLPSTLTMTTLVRLSTIFTDIHAELHALTSLCLCPLGESPPFAELPITQADLLDHLFLTLDQFFASSALHRIPAILAYILVATSQQFNNSLAATIGLVPQSSNPSKTLVEVNKVALPTFFSLQSRSILENAARALNVLQRADPGHPLCQKEVWTWDGPGWGWTDKDLHNMDTRARVHLRNVRRALSIWYDCSSGTASAIGSDDETSLAQEDPIEQTLQPPENDKLATVTDKVRAYKPELADFNLFDQAPGSHMVSSTKDNMASQIISKGPKTLPFSAPTLPLLVDSTLLVLPLAHSRLVSSALLRVFTNRLAFKTHLKVVRGFLLGGDQVFWSRLRGALFEESGISNVSTAVGRGVRAGVRIRLGILDSTRDQVADERAEREGRPREWGVGLAVGLSERGGAGTWPPGGAELGLRLRHVIDDALEVGWGATATVESDDGSSEVLDRGQDQMVFKETSWRLGFILRDLEEESAEGRARWLNPNGKCDLQLALDFLCLDYKPPDPIDVILTPEIRQKMHRVFTFLLRLLRVETVTRMLFNTIFHSTSANPPVVLLARFKIQAFVSSLVGYVADIAIGANWDTFLAALNEIEHGDEVVDEPSPKRDPKKDRLISDIFAVHSNLSTTMDRMLEACLLRARQRGVGNALKECMEAVLVLGKLVGDWCREQSSGSPDLEAKEKHFVLNVTKVLQRFDKLYTALITALRALDLRGNTTTVGNHISSEDAQLLRRRESENESAYGRMATWLDPTGRCVKLKGSV